MMSNKRAARVFGGILGAVALLLCLVISFGGMLFPGFVPAWEDVFAAVGLDNQDDSSYVAVLDVGNADCIVAYSRGVCVLIDSGDIGDNGAKVAQYLKSRNIKQIDYVFLTHYHSDHAGGVRRILDEFPVGIISLPPVTGLEEDPNLAADIHRTVKDKNIKSITIESGQSFSAGDFEFEVLMLDSSATSENDRSAVLKAQIGDKRLLFMADISASGEKQLLEKRFDLKSDFIKIAHHGSASSSSEEFLRAVDPKYAAISCGTRWASVPSAEVLERLRNIGADIKRTDINSHIVYYFDEGGIRIETRQ